VKQAHFPLKRFVTHKGQTHCGHCGYKGALFSKESSFKLPPFLRFVLYLFVFAQIEKKYNTDKDFRMSIEFFCVATAQTTMNNLKINF
jgi:hypothetical protein